MQSLKWDELSDILSEKLKDPVFMEEYRQRLEKSLKELDKQIEMEIESRIMTPERLNQLYTL